jgi:hypothetical protein
MPDYTIGIAERIAALADSTATSNSVNRNYFQETSQSVVNVVNVAIAPPAPTALNPTPDTTYATATDGDSVETFGVQETPIVITLLATIEDAGALAEYLIRSVPAFWFSNLAISLNTLSEENKNIVANLEIGQQIAVTKTFPAGVVPQQVTEYLFVEGISHRVTPETHVVTIYTGPATTYLQWTLSNFVTTTTRTNLVANPNFEVNTTGWGVDAGVTLTRSTADFYSGAASALLSNTIAGQGINNLGNRQSASAGLSYTASAYIKKASGVNFDYSIRLFFYDAGGSILSAPLSGTYTIGAGWERQSVTATAPANTTTIGMQVLRRNFAGAANFYVDALLIEAAASALPYFDGTYAEPYTGYTLTAQGWNGTANASTSTATWGLNSSDTGSPLGDSTYGLA